MDFLKPLLNLVRLGLFLAFALAGCSGGAPYVLHPNEFNRDDQNYGVEPKDIEKVTICYAKSSTTPDDVRKLAQNECAKFKKNAIFIKQDYTNCPATTPVSAHFDCLAKVR